MPFVRFARQQCVGMRTYRFRKHNPLRDWSDKQKAARRNVCEVLKQSSSACIYFEVQWRWAYIQCGKITAWLRIVFDGVGANGNMYSGYGDIKIAGNDMNKLLKLLDPSMNPTITIEPA